MRTLLVVAMVATLVAAIPTVGVAAPGDNPRPTWSRTASITPGTTTATTKALSWDAAFDDGTVVSYNVYGGADNSNLLGSTTSTSIVLTGLDPVTEYTVHVEAVDDDGKTSMPLTGLEFSVPMVFATGPDGSNPHSIDLADFNEDGDIDIAVANKTTSSVGILLGNGDGTFGTAQQFSVETHMDGSGPKNVAVGDFNGDENLDIVSANQDSGDAGVILGNGDGTFGAVTAYVTSAGTHDVVVADFNEDGDPDFVTVGWEGVDASYYAGSAGGTFVAPPIDFNVGLHGHGVLAADLDNDDNLDLAVAANGISSATALEGNGDGTFVQPPGIYDGPPVMEGSGAHDIAVGDFNEDGDEDLVIASELVDGLSVFFGLSPITMAFNDNEAVYDVADEPKGVSVGDVNNDDHDDLIAASAGGHYPACPEVPGGDPLTILLGDGTGSFALWGEVNVGTAVFDAVVYDFNGDGWNDIAAPAWCTDDVSILLGLGEGGPSATFMTLANVPGTPAAPTATPDNGFAEINWTAPASDGGSPVTGYKVELENMTTPSTATTDVGNVLTDTATGLTNGDSYRARVRAYNATGDGAWSGWSSSFVPGNGTTPPPPTGTFIDIDGSVFEADIEWLAASGITKGCNPPVNDRFCPDDNVTRGQMAAFLVRGLGLTDDGGGHTFTDVGGSIFEDDIAKLAAAGITKGCNPPDNTLFCPEDDVTRDQMAAFLVRALGLTDDGGGHTFTDVGGSIFEADIAKLAAAGITRGCNPPDNTLFCPTDQVDRGQMAAFLHRALGT
ncbi:MAG: FG-GAP-like repeat-containing protein [Actinomycetota bacterium]|nr:FG-GAP-like repeat-containing protein [Actinomycetota bacterium]